MAKRPDLDALVVPKGEEAAKPAPSESAAKGHAHTLSLRLTADGYRRLRRFAAKLEDEGAGRVTHQSIIETALNEYISRHGG